METNRKVMDSSKGYQVVEFEQIIERGCGLDVHEKMVVATVNGIGLKLETRTFDTFTSSLQELADWLSSHRITHVAMESTGVYWNRIADATDIQYFRREFPHNIGQCPSFEKCSRSKD